MIWGWQRSIGPYTVVLRTHNGLRFRHRTTHGAGGCAACLGGRSHLSGSHGARDYTPPSRLGDQRRGSRPPGGTYRAAAHHAPSREPGIRAGAVLRPCRTAVPLKVYPGLWWWATDDGQVDDKHPRLTKYKESVRTVRYASLSNCNCPDGFWADYCANLEQVQVNYRQKPLWVGLRSQVARST